MALVGQAGGGDYDTEEGCALAVEWAECWGLTRVAEGEARGYVEYFGRVENAAVAVLAVQNPEGVLRCLASTCAAVV